MKNHRYDSAYETARNKLIPYAHLAASLRLSKLKKKKEPRPGIDGEPYDHCFLTEFFHQEMSRLVREAGI